MLKSLSSGVAMLLIALILFATPSCKKKETDPEEEKKTSMNKNDIWGTWHVQQLATKTYISEEEIELDTVRFDQGQFVFVFKEGGTGSVYFQGTEADDDTSSFTYYIDEANQLIMDQEDEEELQISKLEELTPTHMRFTVKGEVESSRGDFESDGMFFLQKQ